MKKILAILCVCAYTISFSQNTKVVAAYVSPTTGKSIPDPNLITHLYCAFGKVSASLDGVDIDTGRLEQLIELKKQNPKLKVLLSVSAGNFSEMASNEDFRTDFAYNCMKIIEKYKLDGLDIYWIPIDKTVISEDFKSLMGDLRFMFGSKKLLTFVTSPNAEKIDFSSIMPYCDFANMIAYNLNSKPTHNSALYPSEKTELSVKETIDLHVNAGLPQSQMVLGLTFGGTGTAESGVPENITYEDITKGSLRKYKQKWDETCQVPYVSDKKGKIIISFESPESIKLKCIFALDNGLRGVAYRNYADDEIFSFAKAAFNTILE